MMRKILNIKEVFNFEEIASQYFKESKSLMKFHKKNSVDKKFM